MDPVLETFLEEVERRRPKSLRMHSKTWMRLVRADGARGYFDICSERAKLINGHMGHLVTQGEVEIPVAARKDITEGVVMFESVPVVLYGAGPVRCYTVRSTREDAEAGWTEDAETGTLSPTSAFIRDVQRAVGAGEMATGDVHVTFRLTANTLLNATIKEEDFNARPDFRGVLVSRAFDTLTRNIVWGRVVDFSVTVAFYTAPGEPAPTRFERGEVL